MKCPLCNNYLKKRKGKYGEFYGCANYPNCKYTLDVNDYNEFIASLSKIKVNDKVTLLNKTTKSIVEYKIVYPYIEYNSVFVGYGFYGPKYHDVVKKIHGGNPDDMNNPTISSDTPIAKLLLNKKKMDEITYNGEIYKVMDIKKSNKINSTL